MAKIAKGITYSNAIIDLSDMTLTETKKDETIVHDLNKILKEYDGVAGIDVVFKSNTEYTDTVVEE
jgi:hypothetical protein